MLHTGHEVWVECDGKRLEECTSSSHGNKLSCWIDSRAGKTFRIQWRKSVAGNKVGHTLVFKVDSTEVGKHILVDQESNTFYGLDITPATVRPLVFSPNNVDAKSRQRPRPSRKHTGIISVDVYEVRIIKKLPGWKPRTVPTLPDEPWKANGVVMSGHRVTVGPEVPLDHAPAQHEIFSAETIPYNKNDPGPVATFIFNYGPKAYLRAKGMLASSNQRKTDGNAVSLPTDSSVQAIPGPSATSEAPKKEDHVIVKNKDRIMQDNTPWEVSTDVLARLKYLTKQHTEIIAQQDRILQNIKGKDSPSAWSSLQIWQKRLRETQTQLDEITDDVEKSLEPTAKRMKHAHFPGSIVAQENNVEVYDLTV